MLSKGEPSLTDILNWDIGTIVDSINDFAFDLFSKIRQQSTESLFFSPSSLMFSLAMTSAGARETTAEEMSRALRCSLPMDRWHEAMRALQRSTRTGGMEFRIANRLWGQTGYHFLPDFLDITERNYGASLAEVDFRADTEKARLRINHWIEEQTASRIVDLVPPVR